jgi:hypothetical protein
MFQCTKQWPFGNTSALSIEIVYCQKTVKLKPGFYLLCEKFFSDITFSFSYRLLIFETDKNSSCSVFFGLLEVFA